MIYFQVWSSITQTLCYLLTLPSNYTSENHPFYAIILISSALDEFWMLTSGCTEICCPVEYLFPPLRQRGQTLAGQRIIISLILILLFIAHQIPPDICRCTSTCRNLSDHRLSVPLTEFWAFTINCKLTLVGCSRWHQNMTLQRRENILQCYPHWRCPSGTHRLMCSVNSTAFLVQPLCSAHGWNSRFYLPRDCYASEIGQDYWSDRSVVHQTMNKTFRACFLKENVYILRRIVFSVFE